MVETILMGAIVWSVTNLADRLKISSELVAAIIALILAAAYSALSSVFSWQEMSAYAMGAFASANTIYALLEGYRRKDGKISRYIVKKSAISKK